MFFRTKW